MNDPIAIAERWEALADAFDNHAHVHAGHAIGERGFSGSASIRAAAGALLSMWKVHAAQFTSMAGHSCEGSEYHLCAAIAALVALEADRC